MVGGKHWGTGGEDTEKQAPAPKPISQEQHGTTVTIDSYCIATSCCLSGGSASRHSEVRVQYDSTDAPSRIPFKTESTQVVPAFLGFRVLVALAWVGDRICSLGIGPFSISFTVVVVRWFA